MILYKLRASTNEIHKRLEESTLLSKISRQSLKVDEYCSVLNKFYGFIAPCEQDLVSINSLEHYLPDFKRRLKTKLIQKDFNSILLSEDKNDISPCPNYPEIKTLNQAFGYLYVMEGSTLGGKIISENVRKTLGLSTETGVAYFNSYGEERGAMWKNFISYLSRYSDNQKKEMEIIYAATDTFLKLEGWMNQQ